MKKGLCALLILTIVLTTGCANTKTIITTDNTQSVSEAANEGKGDSVVTYEIKTETRTKSSGEIAINYEYPFFSTTDAEYAETIDKINQKFEEYRSEDLDSEESYFANAYNESAIYSQEVFNIGVDEDDKLIFIDVARTQEVNGPHSNNYYDSFVISKQTKAFAKLSDVYEIDEKTLDEIVEQVYAEHSEKDYDVLKNDIEKAINNDNASWRIEDSNLIIWFDDKYITGSYHGDGEYAAVISMN